MHVHNVSTVHQILWKNRKIYGRSSYVEKGIQSRIKNKLADLGESTAIHSKWVHDRKIHSFFR